MLKQGDSSGKLPNGKIKRVPSNSKLEKVRFKSAFIFTKEPTKTAEAAFRCRAGAGWDQKQLARSGPND